VIDFDELARVELEIILTVKMELNCFADLAGDTHPYTTLLFGVGRDLKVESSFLLTTQDNYTAGGG
jgi:hypothetical protein